MHSSSLVLVRTTVSSTSSAFMSANSFAQSKPCQYPCDTESREMLFSSPSTVSVAEGRVKLATLARQRPQAVLPRWQWPIQQYSSGEETEGDVRLAGSQ